MSTPADAIPQDARRCRTCAPRAALGPAERRREIAFTSHNHGAHNHLELIDKTSPYRLRGEFRCIVFGVGFEPSGRVEIELPLNALPRCAAR